MVKFHEISFLRGLHLLRLVTLHSIYGTRMLRMRSLIVIIFETSCLQTVYKIFVVSPLVTSNKL